MTASAQVIGILGASGGVGASVLSCAVAVRATAAGLAAVAVDGVRFGGGLDVTMGIERERGLRWPDIAGVRGRVDGAELSAQLPCSVDVPVLSFDRSRDVALEHQPVREVLTALSSTHDMVVVDLPVAGSETFDWFSAPCDHVVLLVNTAARALAGALALACLIDGGRAELWVCVRSPGRHHESADAVAQALDLPLIGLLHDESGLDTDLQHGLPPGGSSRGPLAEVADQILAQVVLGTGRSVA